MNAKFFGKDILGIGLLFLFLILFLFGESIRTSETMELVPQDWLNVNTIFLSIVIEAIPFILLGVFVSALIQMYISEEKIKRFLPSNAYAALFPAALLGAILPLCECAIVPVVRRLIKKGMPLHVGIVFLVGAPILNPVVFASTYFAFRTDPVILYSRMGLAFVLAVLIGGVLYLLFKNNQNQLKEEPGSAGVVHEHIHLNERQQNARGKLFSNVKQTFYHAADEFFMMGKYLILGAFIAALFQTFLDRSLLLSIGSDEYVSTMVMMAFAYLLSLCSEADAFVASSFSAQFTDQSITGFLVYGPMLDLKNTFMLFAFFKFRFVIAFMLTVTFFVFAGVQILFGLIL